MTRWSAARKAAGPWAARTAYNRGPDPLPRSRGAGVAGRRDGRAARRGERVGRRAAPLRRLDRQAARGARRRQPGRRTVPVVLAARADRAWSGSSRRTSPPLLGLVAELAPVLAAGQRRRGDPVRDRSAARSRPGRGARRLRRAGRRGQPPVGTARRAGQGAGRPPRPERDRRRRRRRRAVGRDSTAWRPRRSSGSATARRRRATRRPPAMRSSVSRRSPSSRRPGIRSAPRSRVT